MSQCHDTYEDPASIPNHLPVRVSDLMTSPAIFVEPTATVKEIAETLLRHDIRSVPIVDVGGLLVGMVSEADLISREGFASVRDHHLNGLIDETLAEHRHHWRSRVEGLTAGEIMTRKVVTCTPNEPVAVVTRRMLLRDTHALPVVEDGHVVGVLSRHDLVRLFDRPDGEVRSRLAGLLASPLWAPEGHQIQPEVLDGVVHLYGTVRFPSDARYMSSVAAQIPGVTEVINRLSATEPDPKPSYLNDKAW